MRAEHYQKGMFRAPLPIVHILSDEARRRELAEFLRSRRERLKPGELGLPARSRRRTPGLRREEVAELAGIGTAWYTWLEQARDIRPSEGALRSIARALKLDEVERRYFFDLALARAPRVFRDEPVPDALQAVLEAISTPAFLKGRRWDLLGYNRIADQVLDLARLPDRNLLRNMFTPASRRLFPNWPYYARQHVAMFRADSVGLLSDPWVRQLVDEMNVRSGEFREWWSEHAVAEMKSGHKTIQHPYAGLLSFDFATLELGDRPSLRLIVYLPTDEETRVGMATLQAHRSALRPSIWAEPGTANT
jgi:transcriptional regulator with XRE-family HTH domain